MSLESLLSGLIGALLVFVLGVARELWRDERERRGLIRLLLAEIVHNRDSTELMMVTLAENPLKEPDFPPAKMEVWNEVRVRAAQLFPTWLFEGLDAYYGPLQLLTTLTRLRELNEAYLTRFQEVYGVGAVARDMLEVYLARPWGERLLLEIVGFVGRLRKEPRRDNDH